VLGAARLERELDPGLADLEVDRLANVLDGEQVGPGGGDRLQERGERARAIREQREDAQAPADRGFVAAREQGEQAGVDVAAGEHDDPRRRGRSGRR